MGSMASIGYNCGYLLKRRKVLVVPVTKIYVPVTTKEKTNKKNDVKARSLLLMALPNEYQLTFSHYNDAKTMFAAIETRFEGVVITQEDLNSNFLTSLPPEWNTHVVVWMNKAKIQIISIDDLYKNFKIVKQSVKKYVGASSGAQNLSFMTAPSTSSTNDANITKPAYEVSTVSPNVNTASHQVSTASFSDNVVYAFMVEIPNGSNLLQQDLEKILKDDLEAMDLKWKLSLLSIRAKRYYQRTGKKIFINVNDTAGYDKSKVECFNCHRWDTLPGSVEHQGTKRVSFDWSDMAEEQVQTNMALMAFSDFECDDLIVKLNQTEFTATTYKRGLATIDEQLITYKKNEDLFSEEIAVLKREVACKDYEINVLKSESEKVKQEKEGIEFKIKKFDKASKGIDKLLGSQITNKDNSKENSDDSLVKEQVSEDTSSFVESSLNVEKETVFLDKKIEFVKPKNHEKPVKKSVSFDHVQAQCKYHQRERMVYGNNYHRVNYNYTTNRTHPNAQRNMVPRAVLMKSGPKSFNTARTINTAHPKSIVFSATSLLHFSKLAQSTIRRPYQSKTVLSNKRFTQTNNTAKAKAVNTARPKAVNTAWPHSAVVNVVRVNQANVVKTLAYWVWRPTKPDSASITLKKHNYIDARGRSKICGGYVTVGGGAHGGKIYGKGILKTNSLDFEDVYFVNELKFKLFSVSQMCDKKNYVLFTDTQCLVLSPNFKLPNESQILLKIPRKDNMYNFDMKNIVPKESLTYLVAKATSDESMLWHRRLSHINFKNINKLVMDKFVRGLPTKRFENDQTCVACLNGKQHRASYK
ncbi:putative ribonuclease H-like domain-containing protein [Tanacetum coccineum]